MTAETWVWIATRLAPVAYDVSGRANGNACGRVSSSSMVVKSTGFDSCASYILLLLRYMVAQRGSDQWATRVGIVGAGLAPARRPYDTWIVMPLCDQCITVIVRD